MFINKYQYLKNNETYLLFFLFLFSFFIRIPVVLILGDISLDNEWRIIINNLTNHGKFSLLRFDDFFVPNLFMPPLYVFYLYFFKFFNFSHDVYIQVILFSQVILSSFSVVIFYKINKFFFSKKICLLGTLIFLIFPLHVYACGQISSVILQSFLLISFIYFLLRIVKEYNFFNICFFSLISGLLTLLRGEFIALFFISILYLILFQKIEIKKILVIILLTLIVTSPYLARNVIEFNVITITKSIGWNLWKGNNPKTDVEGKNYIYNLNPDPEDLDLIEQINQVPKDKYFDINIDKVFLNEGIKNIKNEPIKYFQLYLKKILSFIFIDLNSSYPSYYNPIHYLPILFISITSIIGILMTKKNYYQINFLILFFLANIAIVSIFFILPRYKLTIIPLQIIFSNIFFEYIKNNFFKKNKNA